MSSLVRMVLLAVTIGAAALIVRWTAESGATPRNSQETQTAQETAQKTDTGRGSLARYAIDDFVAACRVRPGKLVGHPYFGSLPIHRFLPDPVSLGGLDALDVEELIVFCGPATESRDDEGRAADLEWAAAARLSRPIELETVMRQWRRSLVPREPEPEARPVGVQIGDYNCFRVPAGTFFPPARTYGKLRFTDRFGQPVERGIDVGEIWQYRGYVEGATKASAVFTLDDIDEADVADGQLSLELRLDVFLTSYRDREHSTAQIELRNPATGLRSEPVAFVPQSHMNHVLNVARTLRGVEAEDARPAGPRLNEGRRQVDLLDDLVSNGRLEVILQVTEPTVYLGVGRQDLNVRPRASEYVFVSGPELIVARTPATLEGMLKASGTPGSLAGRLEQPVGEIVLVASVRDGAQRRAFQRLLRTISDSADAAVWGDGLTGLTATVDVTGVPLARVTAGFSDRGSAGGAKRQLERLIRSTRAAAPTAIRDALGRIDVYGSLLSIATDGVSMSFPDPDSPTAAARRPQLLSVLDDALDGIELKTADADPVLTVEFTEPASLSRLPEAARFGLANLEEVLARNLFGQRRFDLGDEMHERVTDRLPHVPQAWFRRAHQLAYNTSPEFDGYRTRYAWIHRGVDVLLDGAEQNPGTIDLTWMAARFMRKIGESDERAAYRRLFSQDKDLHQRISRFIDLEAARSPDKEVDNWLVARLLFEHCVDRHVKSGAGAGAGAASTIPPLLLFSQPAATQVRYAQALGETGHWQDALEAWKLAEQLHDELGDTTIPLGADRIRLKDLETAIAKRGPDDAAVQQLQAARRRIDYDYWLTRCKLEQMADVQSARKLAYEAAEHERRSEPETAYDRFRQSLEALAKAHQRRPTEMELCAGEFRYVAAGYRKLAGPAREGDEQPVASILAVIEQAQPFQSSFLQDQQQRALKGLFGSGTDR